MGVFLLRICFVGDVVGSAGRRAFKTVMPSFLKNNAIDCCIVNAENSVNGLGASINMLRDLEAAGADLFTMGNHTFSNREFISQISKIKNVARPANFSPSWPGNDYCIFEKNGEKLGVFNLLGQVYANVLPDNPFSCADKIVDRLKRVEGCTSIVLDFHCDATSEKCAMGYYLDGKVSAVAGTHTHVQTADEAILPQGTGYITDAGMCGAKESILGMSIDASIKRLAYKLPAKYEAADGPGFVCGIIFETDRNGRCTDIKRFCEYE